MDDFNIVDDVPADFQLVPLQRVAAAFASTARTLVQRLDALAIPVTRFRKTRGVTVADLARLLVKIRPGISAMPGR